MFAIAIETADRRPDGTNYLGRTLRNLQRGGVFDSPLLHSLDIVSGRDSLDPSGYFWTECVAALPTAPQRPDHPDAKFFWHETPKPTPSRQQNGARAIRAAAGRDAEWVIKLEDDIDVCADFLGSLSRWLDDNERNSRDVPMYTLGVTLDTISGSRYRTPGESVLGPGESFPRVREILKGTGGKARAIRVAVGTFWGAQAILLRRDHARHLEAWLGDDPFYDDGREHHRARGHDLLLQRWAVSLGAVHFGAAVPSFVQHIGRQSTIANPFFEFPWPGPDWSYAGR